MCSHKQINPRITGQLIYSYFLPAQLHLGSDPDCNLYIINSSEAEVTFLIRLIGRSSVCFIVFASNLCLTIEMCFFPPLFHLQMCDKRKMRN